MNEFTVAWTIWVAWFIGWETYALIRKRPGDTFSEHFRKWMRIETTKQPTALTWVMRGATIAFGFWLTTHMAFGWFSV